MNEARILYTVGKKDFILQSKGAHFEKFRRRATRGEITLRFLAALRAAQHGLYTPNLLPTPMYCIVSLPWLDLECGHRSPQLVYV